MATFIYDYTCKYNAFVFIIYGYNHKNLNSNTTYIAYRMVTGKNGA